MEIDSEYVLLQKKYRQLHQDKPNIFPNEWYFVKEYDLKKQILEECLLKNIMIIDSTKYWDFRKKALS